MLGCVNIQTEMMIARRHRLSRFCPILCFRTTVTFGGRYSGMGYPASPFKRTLISARSTKSSYQSTQPGLNVNRSSPTFSLLFF